MIKYVYKPKRKTRSPLSDENYRGRYRLAPGQRLDDVPLFTTDKRVAEQRLDALVREKQHEQAGIIAPKCLRDGAAKPLSEHLRDVVADLKVVGRKRSYYKLVEVRVKSLLAACRWTHAKDVTSDSFLAWRSKQGRAAKTINDYLDAMNVLLNWMERQGRLLANPLKGVGKVKTVGKEKVRRRALTDAEFQRLLSVAGPRKAVYLAAVLTGLRRGELRALQWGDVHLDAAKPFLNVRASTTKNEKTAVIWLRDDLVNELRAVRPPAASPAWRVFVMPKPETFRADLERAEIERVDALGRKVDLHALRHTLATNLARSGVAPRVAMEFMRHSDMRLTNKTYTDTGLLPTADAMDKLPRYDGEPESVAAQATGTDGRDVSEMRSQKRSQTGVTGGLDVSRPVTHGETSINENRPVFPGESRELALAVTASEPSFSSEGDGARTRNHRIDSPVL